MTQARLFILGFAIFICSCAEKETPAMKPTAESETASTASTPGTLTASIDGQPWQASPAWNKDNDAAMARVDPQGLVTIRGMRTNKDASGTQPVEVIEITLKSSQPGTYTLEPSFANLQTATFSIGNDTTQRYFIHEKQSGQAVIA